MNRTPEPVDVAGRGGFLVRIIQGTYTLIAATLAFVVGGAVIAPSFGRRESMWLHAGDAADLSEGTPLPITLRVARPDGPSEVVDRKIVYLVRSAARSARSIPPAPTLAAARASTPRASGSSARATAASTT